MQLSTVNVSRYCEAQGQGKGKVRLPPSGHLHALLIMLCYVMCVSTISDMYNLSELNIIVRTTGLDISLHNYMG